jgi:hypothetical protein
MSAAREDPPRARRPFMPGYEVESPAEGSGLLPWTWAEQRLTESEHYWLSTVRGDGRPHAMPIWGVWEAGALWFSTGVWSRKARNIYFEPRCSVTTQDASEPVVVEGVVSIERSPAVIERFVGLLNDKYGTDYEVDFQNPLVNATMRVQPSWVYGATLEDFTGSATCWSWD